MPEIFLGGLGSGLDTAQIISQMIAVERLPIRGLETKKTAQQGLVTTYQSLISQLQALKSSAESMDAVTKLSAKKATSTNDAAFSAAATGSASVSNYSITVNQLAQAQVLSKSYTSDTTVVGTGTLSITVGTGSAKVVTIDSSNNTVNGIRDAINAANADVTAAVVFDGTNYQLTLTAKNGGAANTIKTTVSGDSDGNDTDNAGLSTLVYDSPTTTNMSQVIAAQSASLTVGGISITRNANVITDVISGVTLTLKKGTSAVPESGTVSVVDDTEAVKVKVKAFIAAYNAVATTISDNSRRGTTPTTASGAFVGDSVSRGIMADLSTTVTTSVSGLSGNITALSHIGVKTLSNGTLTLDETVFASAMATDSDAVVKLFVKAVDAAGVTTSSGVAEEIRKKVGLITNSVDGATTQRIKTLNINIEDLSRQVSTKQAALVVKENALRTRFGRLDQLVAEINRQGASLSGLRR